MGRLITGAEARQAMNEMRQGVALPKNTKRAAETIQRMNQNVGSGDSLRSAMSAASKQHKVGGVGRRHGSLQMALEKPRGPLDRFLQSDLPHKIEDKEERTKIRDLCRTYYKVHNLIPLLIDIYCRFPIQGMTVEHKDPDLKQFYEELFFDNLDYHNFMIDFGREFFTIGEVNSVASYSEILGIWEGEQIINPDDLTVTQSPFSKQERYHLAVPDSIKEIIETKHPRDDYEILRLEYPEYIEASQREGLGQYQDDFRSQGLEISGDLISRLVNKTAPWDLYGTPHMLRVFQNLNLEEGLLAAQKAIADRLYSPLILAKLGSKDLGDGESWLPDTEDLDTFTDLMNQAMSADFRFLTYHYGIEIESVFGRENVPNLDADFDRIERKILQAWGIGESLISGSSNGSYASSALNSELVNNLMSSYQGALQQHFRKRCEVVAEAQGHFETETHGGVSSTIMQEYVEIDPVTGEETVQRRPKLAIPELNFKTITLRDEQTQQDFLMGLKQAGIPIADSTILETVDIDLREEIEKVAKEKKYKLLAQQEFLAEAAQLLRVKGLPLTPELLLSEQQQTAPVGPEMQQQMSMGAGQDIGAPLNTPDIAMDPNAQNAAMQNAQTLPVMPEGMAAMQAPAGPGGPPPSPQVAAPQGDSLLPRNQISQRPEISNNQMGNMPRRAARSMRYGPSTKGLSAQLNQESLDYFATEKPWRRSLRPRQSNPNN